MIKAISKDYPYEYIFVSEDTYKTLTVEEKALRVHRSKYPIGDARAYVLTRGPYRVVQFFGDEHKVHMRKELIYHEFSKHSEFSRIDFYYE